MTDQELQDHWQDALAASGFDDIECTDGQLRGGLDRRSARLQDADNVDAYYSAATDYLHSGSFRNEMDRFAWELHCQGLSIRAIAAQTGMGRQSAHRRIAHYRWLMSP